MRRRASRPDHGFTLIELLIVVAIVGILSAIAIPAMVSAIERARQRKTMADVRTIAQGVEIYYTDYGFYPTLDGEAAELEPLLTPRILKVIPATDGWRRPVFYQSEGERYTMVSHGRNGIADTPYIFGATHRLDDDIVYETGMFYQWPDGVQLD
jgi:type II secretion system protein G